MPDEKKSKVSKPPEQLKPGHYAFYARADCVVHEPGRRRSAKGGTPVMYLGRERVKLDNGQYTFPASKKPFFWSEARFGGARKLRQKTRFEAALWPADLYTARTCGVPYKAVRYVDGEYVEA